MTSIKRDDPMPDDFEADEPSPDAGADGKLEMSQDDIDAIIRNKRKVRDPKACYACHRRKVKCDRNLPCDSCVKRDHPELCSYDRPTKKRRIALTTALNQADGQDDESSVQVHGPNVTVPREQWDRLNKELRQLRGTVKPEPLSPSGAGQSDEDANPTGTHSRSDDPDREGIHLPSTQMGTMHLGSRSVLAYMMGLGRSKSTQEGARSLLEENILPKLGLDNETATYPFVDLWSSESSIRDVSGLCKAIPDDKLCDEFFLAYRDVACTIYPVVPDTAMFKETLHFMLDNREQALRDHLDIDPNKPYGVSLPFLALIFAVLASGAQSSNRGAKERELTSQVYICCSYQALRMSNFMIHPCLETIAASLIMGNVLAYNMNPGCAYIFLGMTVRMAFTIGLQMNSTQNFSETEIWTRRRIWWALAWQDSHFAVSYDRPTASVLCSTDIPYTPESGPGNRSYAETMYTIIRLTQEIIRERLLRPKSYMSWDRIKKYTEEITYNVGQGQKHLRDRQVCFADHQHLERLALKLHSCYVTSELCRPALKDFTSTTTSSGGAEITQISSQIHSGATSGRRRASSGVGSGLGNLTSPAMSSSSNVLPDPATLAHFRSLCIRSLEGCVEAFVELHSISKFAARSWVGIQRAISASFMLGTLPETSRNPHRLALLRSLEDMFRQRALEDPTFDAVISATQARKPGASKEGDGKADNSMSTLAESPNWAKSMSKSLHALGKLNAVFAGPKGVAGTAGRYGSSQQPRHQPSSSLYGSSSILVEAGSTVVAAPATAPPPPYSQQSQPQQQPRYLPPPIQNPNMQSEYASILNDLSIPSISSHTNTNMPQAQPVFNPPQHAVYSTLSAQPGLLPNGPITPDSSGGSSASGEWNLGNVGLHVNEFIHKPLWGPQDPGGGFGYDYSRDRQQYSG